MGRQTKILKMTICEYNNTENNMSRKREKETVVVSE